ncbi:hypothetical protein [Natrinema versiforme]|uniref:DUF7982 domain-containing protein n=1 Tax=Natrinema versiforme TaxID=88724 RepID=A0A4P8WND2_9EURY|nr:hypothetical protein [Natrinema versiforme]QCS44885.1 hypothetical protein FEJ81_21600 [Natrinema versiforme]
MSTTTDDPDRTDSQSSPTDDTAVQSAPDRAELAARAELLAEENARLRDEYARATRTTYRRTARWLAVVGALAVLGGFLFPDGRAVLFALGGTGLFGGILTAYLTPGRFVAADVGECVYAAAATNVAALIDDLALRDERLYLPGSEGASVRLFVPQRAEYELPDDRSGPIVTRAAERGLVLEPTGGRLFAEFERTLGEPLPAEPSAAATTLADAVVEQFELARRAEPAVDADDGRLTVAIDSSAFGDVDRVDHPVASFLAVGVAEALDRPIELAVDAGETPDEWLVTCRWDHVDERTE